jgi:cellulose synthase/poly-beta-1,6-N-acetylglucosamine synthase-like glycosyltransferase
MARGEIVAFTDSDCIPATDWIEKGVDNLLRIPNCGLVAGEIAVFFKDPL